MEIRKVLSELSNIVFLIIFTYILTACDSNFKKNNFNDFTDFVSDNSTDALDNSVETEDNFVAVLDKSVFFTFPTKKTLLINAGGLTFLDSVGQTWLADNIQNANNIETTNLEISDTTHKYLYQSKRVSRTPTSSLNYNISLSAGSYIIKLHFAETWSNAFDIGKRVFDIKIENEVVLKNFDVYKEAGASKPLIKIIPVVVSDEELNITFNRVLLDPFVNAIEIESQNSTEESAPIIISNPATEVIEGESYFYDVDAFYGNNKDNLYFSLTGSPSGMIIDSATGQISWSPIKEQVGRHDIKVNVAGIGNPNLQDEQSYVIDVLPKNDVIMISTTPLNIAKQDVLYTYDLNVSDESVQNVSFELVNGPPGMAIDKVSGLISWVPTSDQIGNHNVSVIAIKSETSITDEQIFIIDVLPVNNVLVINSNAVNTAQQGVLYSYDVNVTHESVQSVSFELVSSPSGMTIDKISGLISWVPNSDQIGNHNITVNVAGNVNSSLSDNQSFSIGVIASGTLVGNSAIPTSKVNLTREGSADWIHWGLNNESGINRKFGVVPQISNYISINDAVAPQGINSLTVYSWVDGAPTIKVSNTKTGLRAYKVNKGFSFTVPADTTNKTLKVYVGVKSGNGLFEASLSDGGTTIFRERIDQISGITSRVITLDFKSASANQVLTVRYTLDSLTGDVGGGWISLESAALQSQPTTLNVFYSEDFSSGLASDWVVVDDTGEISNWSVSNKEYRQDNFVGFGRSAMEGGYHLGTYSVWRPGVALTDYQFNVNMVPLSDSGQDIGVMVRADFATDSYTRLSLSAANGFARLETKSGEVFSTLVKNARGYQPDKLLNVTMDVQGPIIIVKINGEKLFGAYDTSLSSGTIGLYCRDKCAFDDIIVQENSMTPTVVISEPAAYSVLVEKSFNVGAVALNPPPDATVEFQLDGQSSMCTSASELDHPNYFTARCAANASGTYKLTAILKDPYGFQLDLDVNQSVNIGDNYVAIGDSISVGLDDNTAKDGESQNGLMKSSMGYEAILMDLLSERQSQPVIVHKAATPGDTSLDSESQRLPSILERHFDANKAIITLGVNDSSGINFIPSGLGCSGVPCSGTYKGNLQSLIDQLDDAGKFSIVALSPPRFGDPRKTPYPNPEKHIRNLLIRDEYNVVISTELQNYQVGPDFYDYFLGSENRFYLYATNLHPNALGYAVMAHLYSNIINGVTIPPFVVNNLCVKLSEAGSCLNPLTYKENLLEVGNTYYIDQPYTLLNTIPNILTDGRWIMTSDQDRNLTNTNYLNFNVPEKATLYVAYDENATTLPTWLAGNFTDTGTNLDTNNPSTVTMRLYSKKNVLGQVQLGGADAATNHAMANYLVIVVKE